MQQEHVFYSGVRPEEGQRRFVLAGLDGLRAIAVSLVLVYHFWPQVLPGGLIGVDIFFVISGYLITALLLREGAYTGKMDIVAFWVRRIRRLIPAVAVLTLTITPIAFFIGGDILVGIGRQLLGAFTYSSNWLSIAAGNDYFAQTSPELLTNFWSLAVEEQFYFFWPVVLVFACIFLRQWWQRALVPASLGALSLLLATILVAVGTNFARIYYGTDTHLFGLMLGVLLALLIPWSMYPPVDARLYPHVGYGNGLLGFARALAGWLSLPAIVLLAMHLNERNQALLMPWGLLAGSVLGLGVVQALLPDTRSPLAIALRKVLSFAPLVWLGRRSYGIYLWHWPLAVIAHYLLGPDYGTVTRVVLVLLTLVLAGLSYMYVETPVRRLGFRGALSEWVNAMFGRSKALPLTAAFLLLIGCVGTVFAVRTAPEMTQAQQLVAEGEAKARQLQEQQAKEAEEAKKKAAAEESAQPSPTASPTPTVKPNTVTVIGDSVALASAGQLEQKLPQASIDAEVSRQFSTADGLLQNKLDQGVLGDTVVISLATNSTLTPEMVDDVMSKTKELGVKNVVMVTGQAPANLEWVATSNRVIQDAATRYPNLTVADWAAASAGKPQLLASDGVHPNEQGAALYAATVAQAVKTAQAK